MFIPQIPSLLLFMLIEDRIGKRKTIISCLLLASIGSLVMVMSQSMAVAVAGQYLIGLGKFTGTSFGIAMISDITRA